MKNFFVLDLTKCRGLPSYFGKENLKLLCVEGSHDYEYDLVMDSLKVSFKREVLARQTVSGERVPHVFGLRFLSFSLPIGFRAASLPEGSMIRPATKEEEKGFMFSI